MATEETVPADDKLQKTRGHRKQPEVLCSCPQKCGLRIPRDVRERLFACFAALGDHSVQNVYLQSYIEMRSVYRRLWEGTEERVGGRLQRRVSCKYRLPLLTAADGKVSNLSPGCGAKTVEVCQKAFMNVYGVTEKRIRLQREKLIARLRSDARRGLREAVVSIGAEVVGCQTDAELVDSFFRNQLWKPEYIGAVESTDVKV